MAQAQVIAPRTVEMETPEERSEELAQDRQRPGQEDRRALPEIDPTAVPPPARSLPRETFPIPDRWRLVESIGVNERGGIRTIKIRLKPTVLCLMTGLSISQ